MRSLKWWWSVSHLPFVRCTQGLSQPTTEHSCIHAGMARTPSAGMPTTRRC